MQDSKPVVERVRAFEEAVLSQKPVDASHYDEQYFHTQWRPDRNQYTIEARRPIEGDNPRLIKETFSPKKALDFGCGPGALLYFLWELDVDCEGLDFSPYARESAPPAIRDRIRVQRAEEPMDTTTRYDLVICREVLEHLTVLQIQKSVENLCRLSSRFIYVTTRYAKESANLLALEMEPEVDATHISLLNKEMLRCLFVLQGFRSRPDLEAKMDWKRYGRVLVLERVA